tara:strand:+ start:55 stop:216 length:162 start_codon:yes stop_codon:yes gene_type:complete
MNLRLGRKLAAEILGDLQIDPLELTVFFGLVQEYLTKKELKKIKRKLRKIQGK